MKKMSMAYLHVHATMHATVTTIVTICNNYISPRNDRPSKKHTHKLYICVWVK